MKVSDELLEKIIKADPKFQYPYAVQDVPAMARELQLSRPVIEALRNTQAPIGTDGPLLDALSTLDKMEDS